MEPVTIGVLILMGLWTMYVCYKSVQEWREFPE